MKQATHIVSQLAKSLIFEIKKMENRFGKNIYTVNKIANDFFTFQKIVYDLQSKSLQNDELFLFRGEAQDYGKTKITPQLF